MGSKKSMPVLLRLMPKSLRNAVLRRKATLDTSLLDDVVVEVAHTKESYEAAFRLVHDAYVWRGWVKPQRSGQYLTQHHALPETTVFVLRQAGRYIATASLTVDSALGLPIEHTFHEAKALRGPNRRLGEIGTLAVAKGERGTGVTMALFAAVWRYARHVAKVTDLLISVDAHVLDYYEALFGFESLGPARSYAGFDPTLQALDEDPVVGLRQDMAAVDSFLETYGTKANGSFVDVRHLAHAPFPARWEVYPPPASTVLEEARYKLPRPLFQSFFTGPTPLHELKTVTTDYLLRFRTPETMQVTPAQRSSLNATLKRLRERENGVEQH